METKHQPDVTGVRAIARLSRLFETRLVDEGMTLPQFRLLAFLSEGEWAASVLADRLAVSRPSITTLVDGLVDKGWVRREHCPTDRRRVLHHLTEDGRARLGEADKTLVARLDDVLAHVDAEDRSRVLDGLGVLRIAMDQARDAGATR